MKYQVGNKISIGFGKKVLEPGSEISDVIVKELQKIGTFEGLLKKGHIVEVGKAPVEEVKKSETVESPKETKESKKESKKESEGIKKVN